MKKWIFWAVVSISISFGTIILIGFFKGDLDFLKGVPLKVHIITLLGFILLYMLGALSTKLFFWFMGYRLSFLDSLENFFFGNFFSYITPMYIGGQPFQVHHLSKMGVKSEDATNFVMTRLFESFITTLVLDVSVYKYAMKNLNFGKIGSTLIMLGFSLQFLWTTFLLLFLLFPTFFSLLMKPFVRFFGEKIGRLEDWLGSLKKSVRTMWKEKPHAFLIDTLWWFSNISLHALPFYLIFKMSPSFHMSFIRLLAVLSLINTIAYYTPTPGATGGVEGVYHMTLTGIVSYNAVTSALLIWRTYSYYLPILIGMLLLWRMKKVI